jgi:ppGpp synthetase/RelA/SpoT-type nucleotidyltranferase
MSDSSLTASSEDTAPPLETETSGATATLLEKLQVGTGIDFTLEETTFRQFITSAEIAIRESDFHSRLFELHEALSRETVVGTISAVENWANGDSAFRVVSKSWASVVDKLYRINIEENKWLSNPPIVQTIQEMTDGLEAKQQRWITPNSVHEVADDLIRTKFVVPFVDGVVDVSDRINQATNDLGLRRYRKYHAKDTGYHARHHYILMTVPGLDGSDKEVALEVKVLTKMQDTLGELTHLLYEQHRLGDLPPIQKRKMAWLFDSSDFQASYLGHSGHYLEAAIVELKNRIKTLEE